MKFKYGDILCFRPSGFMGYLIRFFDSFLRGQYSHNAIFLKYEDGIPLFIEAHESNERGVAILELEESWKNYDVYRPKYLKPIPKKKLLSLLGEKYNSRRLLDILLLRLFGKPIPKENTKKVICSRVVNIAYGDQLMTPQYETPWEVEKLYKKGIIELVYKS